MTQGSEKFSGIWRFHILNSIESFRKFKMKNLAANWCIAVALLNQRNELLADSCLMGSS